MTEHQPTALPSATDPRRELVDKAAQQWKNDLIDLGGRNQLLYYRDLKSGTLDLKDADRPVVDALIGGKPASLKELYPDTDSRDAALKRVRTIFAKVKAIDEERGVNVGYLALGMATWTPPPTSTTKATPQAPIVMLPLSFEPIGVGRSEFKISVDGSPEINPALTLHLETERGLKLNPDQLIDGSEDTVQRPDEVFARVERACRAVDGFSVQPRYVIGTFSYHKLPMVKDIEASLDDLKGNDLIAALAGDGSAQEAIRSAGESVITEPDATPPSSEHLVLDADSSQTYAVNAVLGAQNTVIKGPPGTGKSQTIANLIASLTAAGKKVLFVAEKRAAIDAVTKRLNQQGLANLVFDAHDGARNKKAVASEMARVLGDVRTIALPDQRRLQSDVKRQRKQLNAYNTALHGKRDPLNVSIFEARNEVLELEAVHGSACHVDLRLHGADLERLNPERIERITELVREFARLGGPVADAQESPWANATVTTQDLARSCRDLIRRIRRDLSPALRHVVPSLEQQLRPGASLTLGDLVELLEALNELPAIDKSLVPEAWQAQLEEMTAATAPGSWRKANPDWPGSRLGMGERRSMAKAAKRLVKPGRRSSRRELSVVLQTASRLRGMWRSLGISGDTPFMPDGHADAATVFDFMDALDALRTYLPHLRPAELTMAEATRLIDDLVANEAALQAMPRLHEIRTELDSLGLGKLPENMAASGQSSVELATAAWKWCLYRSFIDEVSFADTQIGTFVGARHDEAVKEFQRADREHVKSTRDRVLRAHAEWVITAQDAFPDQAKLVEHEAGKSRRLKPLRALFKDAPDVMLAVKPCWAMSPLVVSQLLPNGAKWFDVIVFDEASQVEPADAVPALARAKQVVVAGDEHQLPPTPFFGSTTDDTDDNADDEMAGLDYTRGYESVLDQFASALGIGRVRHLAWHYRSLDERLIAFSNRNIYAPDGNQLVTFPGVAGSESIRHVQVESTVWSAEEQVSDEVEKVVNLVVEHARDRPDESLGVITLGANYARRLDDAIRRQVATRPELEQYFSDDRSEAFFVKNLERVQGDERDAIIISLGVGATNGKLNYTAFGPLNRHEHGHRRLNVAVTRAKRQMTMVSSLSHHDMDPRRSSSKGVELLRLYLQFAASGGRDLGGVAEELPLNPFESDVRDHLRKAGIPLISQYGVDGYRIDFAASHPDQPGRMVLAIEADGASYHSSQSARDRDRLRQEHLERIGWRFHRIWSTDWFSNRDRCIQRAREAFDLAIAAADSPTTNSPAPPSVPHPAPDGKALAPAAPQRAPRPLITRRGSIADFTVSELKQVLHWIQSDRLPRTKEETFREWMTELGFARAGKQIRGRFDEISGR